MKALLLHLFFLSFHQLGPVSLETAGKIRKLLERVQTGRNILLVRLEVTNVLQVMLQNYTSHVCLSYFKQVTVAAEHNLNNFSILVSSKALFSYAFIMNYQENERILCLLMYFRDLLLNDSLVLCSNKGVDQEDVEHRNDLFKNVFFDQTVSISHRHKHRMLEVVVELDLYAAIADQRL